MTRKYVSLGQISTICQWRGPTFVESNLTGNIAISRYEAQNVAFIDLFVFILQLFYSFMLKGR